MTGLPILTYHAIDDSGSVIATHPKQFAETLAALHAEGFRCVDLHGWIEEGRPAIDRGFALAFDDGLASIFTAAEAISRFSFAATAFLVTGWMGRHNHWPGQAREIPRSALLNCSDLDDLAAAGLRFGAHTVDHPDLARCDPGDVERQMLESQTAVEDRTGRACRLFAYPYGRESPRVRRVAARHFDAAFGTRLDVASPGEDPFAISRIDAYYLRSPRVLNRFLSGNWSGWLRARRAARAVRRSIRLAGIG